MSHKEISPESLQRIDLGEEYEALCERYDLLSKESAAHAIEEFQRDTEASLTLLSAQTTLHREWLSIRDRLELDTINFGVIFSAEQMILRHNFWVQKQPLRPKARLYGVFNGFGIGPFLVGENCDNHYQSSVFYVNTIITDGANVSTSAIDTHFYTIT